VNKPLVIVVRSKICDLIREDFHDRCRIEPLATRVLESSSKRVESGGGAVD
jgi:hypothetical protein